MDALPDRHAAYRAELFGYRQTSPPAAHPQALEQPGQLSLESVCLPPGHRKPVSSSATLDRFAICANFIYKTSYAPTKTGGNYASFYAFVKIFSKCDSSSTIRLGSAGDSLTRQHPGQLYSPQPGRLASTIYEKKGA